MDKLPFVSIIIPVYNGANYLREAIDSALLQTYKNIEIIVVNDGSNDNDDTRNIALSYGDKIRYFEKENGGVSSALNLGINNMRGEYFSWLSHDDLYHPRKIQASIEAVMKANDKTLSVVCNSDFLVMPERSLKKHFLPYKKNFNKYGIYFFLCGMGVPLGCSLLIHRSYFEKYGLFDVTKKTTQDYYQWFKFYKNNSIIYVKDVLVHIRLHPEQSSHTEAIMSHEENEMYIYFSDNISQLDIANTGLSLYQFYSMLVSRLFSIKFKPALCHIIDKMKNIYNEESAIYRIMLWGKFFEKRRIILYCAGRRFKKVYFYLYSRGIPVYGFSDTNEALLKKDKNGLIPLLPSDLNKEDDFIVITKRNPEDLKVMLSQTGFKNVYSFDDIFDLIFECPIKKEFLDEYEKWL